MESQDEAVRLDMKTDPESLQKQALWCGVKPGLRVLDLGCGAGKTSFLLHEMVKPSGSVVGIDYSSARIDHARKHYGAKEGIDFLVRDLTEPFDDIEPFDIIWVRFVLEYYRRESLGIVNNLKKLLKPGGYLCLLDLDINCLGHYELPSDIADLLPKLMTKLDRDYNFDTYAGRKLYSYLYDAGYEDIQMELMAHHLIYGEPRDVDIFNWMKKLEIANSQFQDFFECYHGGYDAFFSDFKKFFSDPRRFTYTPLILSKGRRPLSD